jgi:hypothetical protein
MGFLLESPVQLADSQGPYLSTPKGALHVAHQKRYLVFETAALVSGHLIASKYLYGNWRSVQSCAAIDTTSAAFPNYLIKDIRPKGRFDRNSFP